ncbi:MAG: hypothetical protein ACRC4W_06005 [Treponemataceae bacterium]
MKITPDIKKGMESNVEEYDINDLLEALLKQKHLNFLAVLKTLGNLQIKYLNLLTPLKIFLFFLFAILIASFVNSSATSESLTLQNFSNSIILISQTIWSVLSSAFTLFSAGRIVLFKNPNDKQ